jgi:hypothetical protein
VGVDQESGGVVYSEPLLFTDIPLQYPLDEPLPREVQGGADDVCVCVAAAQDCGGEVWRFERQLAGGVVMKGQSNQSRLVGRLRM